MFVQCLVGQDGGTCVPVCRLISRDVDAGGARLCWMVSVSAVSARSLALRWSVDAWFAAFWAGWPEGL